MLRHALSAALVVLTLAGCGIGNTPTSIQVTSKDKASALSWEPGLDDAMSLARGTLSRYEELRKEVATYSGSNETQEAVQAMQHEIEFITDRLDTLASLSTRYPNSLIIATISKTVKRTLTTINPTVQEVASLTPGPLSDFSKLYLKLRTLDTTLYPVVSRALKDIGSAQGTP